MGPAIDALGDVVTYLKHNPIIAVVGMVAALVTAVANFISPIVNLVVAPLLIGGMLATIWAGRNGDAGVDDFLAGAKDNYLSLLGGTFLFGLAMFGAVFVATLVSMIPMFVLGLGSSGASAGPTTGGMAGGMPGGAMLAGLGILLFAFVAIFVVVIALFAAMAQLFDVAIVVEGRGAIGGLNRAWELFKAAPTSVIGYTFLRGFVSSLLIFVPVVVLATLGASLSFGLGGGEQALGITVLAIGIVYVFVLIPLSFIFSQTYHVAYFNRLTAAVG